MDPIPISTHMDPIPISTHMDPIPISFEDHFITKEGRIRGIGVLRKIETLQEVAVDTNLKSKKGWRDGYLVRVEELMAMKVSMAGLKANPHIESRWKYLKRKYHALADMRASSGFGWDETTKKIQCDKKVYESYSMTNGVRC